MQEETSFVQRQVERWKTWRTAPIVTVLRLQGVLSPTGGPLRPTALNLHALDHQIRLAFRPQRLKAVALQVNCPGGSPVQSALIARAIRARADERKVPVYAFAEDVAASGGYWLMTAADEIYADEASLLGSIGVIYAGFGFQALIERFGIERRIHTAGEQKSFLDPFQPEKQEDVARLETLQTRIHDQFSNQVKARRGDKLNRRRYKEIFSGDIFLGEEAQRLGLIDGIADMRSFLTEKYGKDVRIKRIPVRRSPFRGLFGGGAGAVLAEIEERLLWSRFGL